MNTDKILLPKILIVDDKIENIIAIKSVLEDVRCELFEATSGEKALALVIKHEFALMFLDVQMPEMDGLEVAYILRNRKKTQNIPIVFVTAYKNDEHLLDGYTIGGAVDYLYKPIIPEILISKANVFLNLYNEKKKYELLYYELGQIKKELEEKNNKLKDIATLDALTGLYNRFAFEDMAGKIFSLSVRKQTNYAVLLIDIDNFKHINDTYGHPVGDFLLKEVSVRLKQNLRTEDIIARIGGDEFAVVIYDLNDNKEVEKVAQKLVSISNEPVIYNKKRIFFSISLGYSISSAKNLVKYNELVKEADLAMYRAKQSGKNGYQEFTKKIEISFNKSIEIEKKLSEAFENNEFSLLFQPIINLNNSKISGFESLLRWTNKDLGVIPPSEFIPLAENNRQIHNIGKWVVKNSLIQAEKWEKDINNDFFMSINFSPIQFERKNFNLLLEHYFDKYNFPAEKIVVELSDAVYSLDLSVKLLFPILKTSVQLAIDDFGAGYSSIKRLGELPVEYIKIDGSYIKDICTNQKNREITKNIIMLAKSLNIKTIAECVENEEQVQFLKENNCDFAQGFYFYKPLSSEKIFNLLKDSNI